MLCGICWAGEDLNVETNCDENNHHGNYMQGICVNVVQASSEKRKAKWYDNISLVDELFNQPLLTAGQDTLWSNDDQITL